MNERDSKVLPACRTSSQVPERARALPKSCLTALFEHSMEAVVVTDPAGNIVCVNNAFEKHTGYSPDEVVGRNPRILKSGHHGPEFYRRLWGTVTSGRPWREHVVNRCKDGSLIEVEQVITPVFSESGEITHFMSVWRNVSRERELLEMARASQKMEHIGQLAVQIAHDFNNALTGVKGFAELLAEKAEPGSEDALMLREILNAAYRASKLAAQLLRLGGKRRSESETTDVNVLVTRMLPFLRRLLGPGIKLVFEPHWEATPVTMEALKLEQILLNLCVNARDAMPHGGTVTIGTAEIDRPDTGERSVLLSVADTGCGMSPETIERAFEPFFTTKDGTDNSGLGLAIVKGVLEESGGTVEVSSELGRGTEFRVFLPLAGTTGRPDTSQEEGPLLRGRGRVLVLEPDPFLLEAVQRMLLHLGYTPLRAKDSPHALEVAAEGPIDAAVLSSELPMLSADKVVDRLRELVPGIRFVVAVPDGACEEHPACPGCPVLVKPYGIRSLSRALHAAIHGSGEGD